jgi:hypothetical protein
MDRIADGRARRVARQLAALVAGVFLAGDAQAQLPEGWIVRTEDDGTQPSAVSFVAMAPGWHLTTGPAAILYHPDSTASGRFRVESEIFLFEPGTHDEPFGILFGGDGLGGPSARYGWFAIRRSGEFAVLRRTARGVEVLRDWSASDAVVPWPAVPAEGQATVKNVLAIDIGASDITFSVNGATVATLPRADLPTDGIVGLRVGDNLNLHVTALAVSAR